MINYDRRRGGVEVRVEAGPKVASRLRVNDARPQDSGNYTCAAANTEPASVFVYVTEGNTHIQTDTHIVFLPRFLCVCLVLSGSVVYV